MNSSAGQRASLRAPNGLHGQRDDPGLDFFTRLALRRVHSGHLHATDSGYTGMAGRRIHHDLAHALRRLHATGWLTEATPDQFGRRRLHLTATGAAQLNDLTDRRSQRQTTTADCDSELAVVLRQTQWVLDDAAHDLPAGRMTPQRFLDLAGLLDAVAAVVRATAPPSPSCPLPGTDNALDSLGPTQQSSSE